MHPSPEAIAPAEIRPSHRGSEDTCRTEDEPALKDGQFFFRASNGETRVVDTGSSWLKDALQSQGLLPLPSITEEKVLSSDATSYSTTLSLEKSWLACLLPEKRLPVVETLKDSGFRLLESSIGFNGGAACCSCLTPK